MTDENTAQILNTGLESLTTDPTAQEDFSKAVVEVLKKVDDLAKAKRYDEAVEEILLLEKKCRQGNDGISCSKLCCKILSMYHGAGPNWPKVFEYMQILSKKRGQMRRAITDMVLMGMEWVQKLGKKGAEGEIRTQLMTVLDGVTDGKIFVEVERARLIKIMADDKEAEGKMDEAAQLLQEVQVETFGSMDKHEKALYILNQMRIMLVRKDYVRVQIASRKINEKFLDADDFQDIKLEYYGNMIKYYLHEENFFDASTCYQKMLKTKKVEDDEKLWKPILSGWILYLCLSLKSEKQDTDMKKCLDESGRKKLEAVESFKNLMVKFRTKKLIEWPLKEEKTIKGNTEVFGGVDGEGRWKVLRQRVIQHNIRTIALYYVKVSTKRLMDLLGLTQKELETELAELVTSKALYARIDRPVGIIRFGTEPKSEDKLSDWSSRIDKVLDLIQETGHLIQKERMIQEAKAKLKKK